QPPLMRWLRDSTLMLPLYVLAVLAAVLLARRWAGQSRRTLVKLGATALLITLISSVVCIAEVAASSAYDYHFQSRDLALVQNLHHHQVPAQPGSLVSTSAGGASTCAGLCSARQTTLKVHVRAVKYASAMLLLTNLVLVAWVLALRCDRRLWQSSTVPVRHRAAMIW